MRGKDKKSFQRELHRSHPLRFHMTAILLATALSGVLASKLFLLLHLEKLVIRYPLAVLVAYIVFFLCIKLWLIYVSPGKRGPDSADLPDIPTPSSGGSHEGVPASLQGRGGEFSGAGASGAFDVNPAVGSENPVPEVAETASGLLDSAGDSVGDAAEALGEEAGIIGFVVIAILSAVVVAIVGGAVYVITEAPAILSEAAFEGLLAASLVKKARIIDDEDWIGSVFKTTWKSFAIAVILALGAAFLIHSYFPEATKISDILR